MKNITDGSMSGVPVENKKWFASLPRGPHGCLDRDIFARTAQELRDIVPEIFSPPETLAEFERWDGCILEKEKDLPDGVKILTGKEMLQHEWLKDVKACFLLGEDGRISLLPFGRNDQRGDSQNRRYEGPSEGTEYWLEQMTVIRLNSVEQLRNLPERAEKKDGGPEIERGWLFSFFERTGGWWAEVTDFFWTAVQEDLSRFLESQEFSAAVFEEVQEALKRAVLNTRNGGKTYPSGYTEEVWRDGRDWVTDSLLDMLDNFRRNVLEYWERRTSTLEGMRTALEAFCTEDMGKVHFIFPIGFLHFGNLLSFPCSSLLVRMDGRHGHT